MSTQPDGHEPDQIILGHTYDGIREYDNPMPGWWVWLFVATIVFAPFYLLGVHVFGFINTYEDDLAESQAKLEEMRAAYAAANPGAAIGEAQLAAFVADPSRAEAGAATYAAFCAACHGDVGQGLIGPNLTDEYWIHGGSDFEVFTVISEGVPDKGMPGWEASIAPEQRAELVAFIQRLAGTNPPGAKGPEGERVDRG